MANELFPYGLKKIIQRFSKAKLEEFRHLSAGARLAWLEEIKRLYWKAGENRHSGSKA